MLPNFFGSLGEGVRSSSFRVAQLATVSALALGLGAPSASAQSACGLPGSGTFSNVTDSCSAGSQIQDGNFIFNNNTLNVIDGSTSFDYPSGVPNGLFETELNGTFVNLSDGAANDRLFIQDIELNGASFAFDFDASTGSSDIIVANAINLSGGVSTISLNVVNGSPTQRGIATLIQTAGQTPFSSGTVVVSQAFQFSSDPSTADTRYVLLEQKAPATASQDVDGAGRDTYSVFLLYYPKGTGPTGPSNINQAATVNNQLDSTSGVGADVLDGGKIQAISPTFGVFASGRLAHSWHDGFETTSVNANGGVSTGRTADYQSRDLSFFGAAQLDVTKLQGISGYGLKVGAFTGFARTMIDMGTSDELLLSGILDAGEADNTSYVLGGFTLLTYQNFYALSILSGSWGSTDVDNGAVFSTGEYDTRGIVYGGLVGAVWPLQQGDQSVFGQYIGLDTRVGVSSAHNEGDAFTDSTGNVIGKSEVDLSKVTISAKLFTTFAYNGGLYVPYVQGGYEHRFEYDNTVTSNGVLVAFDDSDANFYGLTGITTKIADGVEFNGNLRGDFNEDQQILSGQLGLKFELN